MSFKTASLERDGKTFKLSMLELGNSVLVFFYDKDMRLGTLAVALPALDNSQVITSSLLLGGKHMLLVRALAERVASVFRKMSLASAHVDLLEPEGIRIAVALLDQLSPKKSQ